LTFGWVAMQKHPDWTQIIAVLYGVLIINDDRKYYRYVPVVSTFSVSLAVNHCQSAVTQLISDTPSVVGFYAVSRI